MKPTLCSALGSDLLYFSMETGAMDMCEVESLPVVVALLLVEFLGEYGITLC